MPTLFKEAKMGVKLLKKRLGVTDVSFVKTVISIYWSPKHGDENLQVFSIVFLLLFLSLLKVGPFCRCKHIEINIFQAEAFMREFDTDSDGKLSFTEFQVSVNSNDLGNFDFSVQLELNWIFYRGPLRS